MTLLSTISLLGVFIVMQILQHGFISVAAYLSDFNGEIMWNALRTIISSESWSYKQVILLYLSPFVSFLFLFILLNFLPKAKLKENNWVSLLYSWAYLLLLLKVFLIPVFEIINHKGIYHALNWMYFNKFEKLLFGIIVVLVFMFRIFRTASLFSKCLILPSNKFLKKKQIITQLPFLWFVPFTILVLFVFLLSEGNFVFPFNYFLFSLLFSLLINTWLISRYDVIVK